MATELRAVARIMRDLACYVLLTIVFSAIIILATVSVAAFSYPHKEDISSSPSTYQNVVFKINGQATGVSAQNNPRIS
jgi:hypothetical protein